MEKYSSNPFLDLEEPCDVCGAVGYTYYLLTCFRCNISREHVYCMRLRLADVPGIWICEVCLSSTNRDSVSMSQGTDMVHNNSKQAGASRPVEDPGKSMHLKRKHVVEKGKVKFISSEEAIKLSSATKNAKHLLPPPNWGSRSGKSTMINRFGSTSAGIKPPIPRFSQPRMRTNPNFSLKIDFTCPGHGVMERSPITQPQMSQMKALRISDVRKNPMPHLDKYTFEKPADIMPVKRVKASSSTKWRYGFTPSPSRDALPIIGPGASSGTDLNTNSMGIPGRILPDILPKLEKYIQNHPFPKPTWCGSLEITISDSISEFCDGFWVHVPSKVHRKAFEASKRMPGVLVCTVLPFSKIRTEVFQNEYPSVDDVAVYFFPCSLDRSKDKYERLLENMQVKDLALRSHLGGVELLVFPSKCLHLNFQGLKPFLWGVYRRLKSNP